MVSDLGFYWQTIKGHWQILSARQPVSSLLADQATAPALRERLERAQRLRNFASDVLDLPDNDSYREYADLGRPFVVWNVVATPRFSLTPYQWCFPVAGCVTYRGYHDEAQARAEGDLLRGQGYDVQVAGVPAYSTLGWFDDPLLSTFIGYPEVELARLIFHELAHQVVYVQGDTAFNESFATAVEQLGLERWLAAHGSPEQAAHWLAWQSRRADFLALLQRTRDRLETLYAAGGTTDALAAGKRTIFDDLVAEYRELRDGPWEGFKGYDRWFEADLGNAHLAAIAAYSGWVPAFRQLYAAESDDFSRFYLKVKDLARLDPAARRNALRALDEASTIRATAR